MSVVVDASAVVDAVCLLGDARRVLGVLDEASVAYAPDHLDAEVLSALGRMDRAGLLATSDEYVEDLRTFPVERMPLPRLLPHAWSLRGRVALRDAIYVALARTLDAALLTSDHRLARACEGLVELA